MSAIDAYNYWRRRYEAVQRALDSVIYKQLQQLKKKDMENNTPYYITYKFFDTRGRRLAIFAVPTYKVVVGLNPILEGKQKPDTLHIYVITCSKRDSFCKQRARELFAEFTELKRLGYDGAQAHPSEFQIPVEEDKPKFTFLRWCEENYYKYRPYLFAIDTVQLSRGEDVLGLGMSVKWDMLEIQDADKIPQSTSIN